MQLLIWMFLGALVGWGSGRVLHEGGYDWFRDVVMGIGGSVVGGILGNSAGYDGHHGTIFTVMVAMVGAMLLRLLVQFGTSRRAYARPV